MTQTSIATTSEDAASKIIALPPGVSPADFVAELVAAVPERNGDDYLVYERNGEWTLASGARTAIELDSDELRLVTGDVVRCV